jgi:hypothetical protein
MTFWIVVYMLCGCCTLAVASRWFGWMSRTSTARKVFSGLLMFVLWPLFWLSVVIDGY